MTGNNVNVTLTGDGITASYKDGKWVANNADGSNAVVSQKDGHWTITPK